LADALEIAAREGNLEDVRRLIDAGARPDRMNIYGDTLVEMARDRGHDEVATFVEQACQQARRVAVSPTHTDHPIHVAAEAGDLPRVRELIDSDPSLVRISDRRGGTALHRAVIGRSRQVVELLLDRGADIHAIHGEGLGTREGYAPENLQAIDLAIWGGPATTRPSRRRILWSCVKWLLWRLRTPRDAPISRRPCDESIARLLIARGATCDVPIAAALGDLDDVRAMLDADSRRLREARPNARLALSAAAEFGRLDVVKLLLDLGNDVNARDTSEGRTALMGAAHKGRIDVITALVEHGAKLDTHDVGSRDTIYKLAGVTWQAIDYADGLVRVGVQSAIPHPEAAALLRDYMKKAGLKTPPAGRTLDSICVTDLCR